MHGMHCVRSVYRCGDYGGINDRGYDRVRSCDTICDAQREKERSTAMKEFLSDSVFLVLRSAFWHMSWACF